MATVRRILLLLWASGCSSGAVGDVALSWHFVDGRRCPESGAASVAIQIGDGATQSFRCAEGLRPAAVTLKDVSGDGVVIRASALSTDGAPLYSGTLDLDVLPSEATLTLYADKMR
jgi:hypothetical protein